MKVKCAVCGEMFDKEKIQCVKYNSRRYAHFACFPEGEPYEPPKKPEKELTQTEKDKKECEDYICAKLGIKAIDARIRKQLNRYLGEGKNYKSIFLTLYYWYEVKKSDPAKAQGGIGIVGYIYEDAAKWYQQQMIVKQAEQTRGRSLNIKTEEITIARPMAPRRKVKSFLEGVDLSEE